MINESGILNRFITLFNFHHQFSDSDTAFCVMLNLYIYTQNIETENISWLAEVGVSTASIY